MKLYQDGQYETASRTCTATFAATGDPEAGLAAARSEYRLGHDEAALAWLTRLHGTPTEASAWIVAGAVQEKRGDPERARESYRAAVILFRKAGNEKGLATAFQRLFNLSWQGSRYREALELGAEALDHATRSGDRTQEVIALEGLFSAVYDVGDLQGAGHLLDRIRVLLNAERDPAGWANLLNNRGAILLDGGHTALARPFFEDALRVTGADREVRRSAHLNLVQASLVMGDLPAAEAHLGAARELLTPDGTSASAGAALAYYGSWLRLEQGRAPEAARLAREALTAGVSGNRRWQLEYRLGRALDAMGSPASAREAYGRGTRVVDALRAEVGNDDLKSWLLEQRRQPFEALFRLTLAQGRPPEQALDVVERAQARALLDAFVESASRDAVTGAPPPRPAPPSSWSLADARARFDSLQAVLPAEGDSSVAALPPIRELVARVSAEPAIVYFYAESEIWMLRIAEGRIEPRRLGTVSELGPLVDRFVSRPDDAGVADRLGARLFPTGVLPAAGVGIRVVPDGALRSVPFAALRVGGRYLVEAHAIAYVPAVSALGLPPETSAAPRGPAVVIGDPGGDLPGARQEALEVAARLAVVPAVGHEATRTSLERAAHADLLHVATHTWLGPGGPWLALADQSISASSVIRMGLRPRLAVLASCSGAVSRGKGYWGSWATAFLASGAHAVVTSLWSIDDAASRDFVVRFYEHDGAAEPVAALARAQRDFIAAGHPPSVWAPFVCVGSQRLGRASAKEGV